MARRRTRLSLDVDKSFKERLERRKKGGISFAETVRRSEDLLTRVENLQRKGGRVIFRSKEGSEETVIIL